MNFDSDQKSIAKRLSFGAKLYRSYVLGGPIFREQFEDGYKALVCFISNYAYERQGAPSKAYADIGKKAIEQVFGGHLFSVSTLASERVWEAYELTAKEEYNSLGTNHDKNPLSPEKGNPNKKSVIQLLAEGQITNNNLSYYVKYLLENRRTVEASQMMSSIRGISDKIAAFYLRDIAYLGTVDEDKISEEHLLQPIDTWLNQALMILFGRNMVERSRNVEKQKQIVDLCREAKVSCVAFNQGAWILAREVSGDFHTFEQIARGSEAKSLIEKHLRDRKEYASKLEVFVNEWPEA